METQQEIFKDIPGYEGLYQVSNLGRVKSLDKYIKTKTGSIYLVKGRYLKGAYDGQYFLVGLYKNKKQKSKRIHQLVAMAFLKHIPCGYKIVVDHIDNNSKNNNILNLQIIHTKDNSCKNKKSKTGYYCIYFVRDKYLVRTRVNNKKHTFGYYYDIKNAIKIRDFVIDLVKKEIDLSEIKKNVKDLRMKDSLN